MFPGRFLAILNRRSRVCCVEVTPISQSQVESCSFFFGGADVAQICPTIERRVCVTSRALVGWRGWIRKEGKETSRLGVVMREGIKGRLPLI